MLIGVGQLDHPVAVCLVLPLGALRLEDLDLRKTTNQYFTIQTDNQPTYQTVGRIEATAVGEGHRLDDQPQRSAPLAAVPLAGELRADAVDLHEDARLSPGVPHEGDVVSVSGVQVDVKDAVGHGEVDVHQAVLLVAL